MIDVVRAKKTLEAALELIKDPARWIQGDFAHSAIGDPVDPNEGRACRWCALGAVRRAGGPYYVPNDAVSILHDEAQIAGKKNIVDLNDEGTHADVVEMFKRAIAACDEVAS